MSLILLAGMADCPYFAQLEHDFEYVQNRVKEMILTKQHFMNLEDFKKFKEEHEKIDKTLHDSNLPIVLREFQNVNGAYKVLGGFSEAREYLSLYYGYNLKMNTEKMEQIATANKKNRLVAIDEAKTKSSEIENRIINVSILDTEQEQISYHFVPIFLNFMQNHEPTTLVNLSIIHSYDEELASALKMELEDCAFSNLTTCNTIPLTSSACEVLNSSKYIFVFDHLDKLKEHSSHFNEKTLLIVHLVGSQKNIEFNHKLDTIGHENVLTTLPQSYELAVKATLAKELSGKHSSNVDLKINSSQIKNVAISGQVGIDGEWEVDLSNCQICDIENSAISGHRKIVKN